MKKIKQILELTPKQHHKVYYLVESVESKKRYNHFYSLVMG